MTSPPPGQPFGPPSAGGTPPGDLPEATVIRQQPPSGPPPGGPPTPPPDEGGGNARWLIFGIVVVIVVAALAIPLVIWGSSDGGEASDTKTDDTEEDDGETTTTDDEQEDTTTTEETTVESTEPDFTLPNRTLPPRTTTTTPTTTTTLPPPPAQPTFAIGDCMSVDDPTLDEFAVRGSCANANGPFRITDVVEGEGREGACPGVSFWVEDGFTYCAEPNVLVNFCYNFRLVNGQMEPNTLIYGIDCVAGSGERVVREVHPGSSDTTICNTDFYVQWPEPPQIWCTDTI